jgi:hypothetical protein
MPAKKTVKKTAKKAPKKAAKRTVKKAKKAAPRKTVKVAPKKKVKVAKKGETYECRVCGVRVIVDEICGCVEEHTFICCKKPMKKKRAKKKA